MLFFMLKKLKKIKEYAILLKTIVYIIIYL